MVAEQLAGTASNLVLESAPKFSSVELASTALTAATVVLAVIPIALAIMAFVGIAVIRKSAITSATRAGEKVMLAELREYLGGPELEQQLARLVDESHAKYIRARIPADRDQREADPLTGVIAVAREPQEMRD